MIKPCAAVLRNSFCSRQQLQRFGLPTTRSSIAIPLEFANGPYSARAIEQKSASPGSPHIPGSHDLPVAFSYFLKSAELNMAEGSWQRLWVALLLAGTLGDSDP